MKKIFFSFILWRIFTIESFAQPLYFPPVNGTTWTTLSPESLNWCQNRIDSLFKYLDDNNTKAFIILKDGKIVLEKYFGTHTVTTPWQWASAGKTITAFMVGIAQQENKLSISDKTSKYLGQGWTSCTPQQEDKITIWNQLTMTSGLDDNVPDHFCTLKSCLIYKADAGTRWAYHNGPYTLLDSVMEKATGTSLNTYTTLKLKNPTGMTGQFVKIGYNNVFFSTARSMARFGLLMLNKGNWNGTPVMTDMTYFNQQINTSQQINKSYGYLWWLNGKSSHMLPSSQFVFNGSICPNAPADMYAGMGKDGQFVNVVPSQNLVWVRMGEAPDGLPVPYLLNDNIWSYINQLNCNITSVNEQSKEQWHLKLFPNPSSDFFQYSSEETIRKMEVYSQQGQLLKTLNNPSKSGKFSVTALIPGHYILKVDFASGGRKTIRFTKD
jgi:CubicO group peptidase (beta-lactamase class C family)